MFFTVSHTGASTAAGSPCRQNWIKSWTRLDLKDKIGTGRKRGKVQESKKDTMVTWAEKVPEVFLACFI